MSVHQAWSLVQALFWRWWVALCVIVVLVLAVTGTWWALHQAGPTARILSWLPGVTVVEPRGGLLGDFSAQRLEIRLPRQSLLTLIEPHWKGLTVRHDPSAAWSVGVDVTSLEARRADLHWVSAPVPAKPAPSRAPQNLDLPVSVRIGLLRVGAVHSNLWAPQVIENVDLQLSLQGSCATTLCHRVVLKQADVHGWSLQGLATVKTRQDLALDLALQARRRSLGDGDRVGIGQADLTLQGPLSKLSASGQVHVGEGLATAQSLVVSGDVTPFESWPVSRLALQTKQFDLALLWPSLPQTALSGQILAQPTAATAKRAVPDLTVDVALDNALAGPWDAARLPIQRVAGRVELPIAQAGAKGGQLASLGQTGQVALTLTMPRTSSRGPGTVAVSGGWDLQTPQKTNLRADIQGLEPQALDGRAPPLQLQGYVTVRSAPAPAPTPGHTIQETTWERWAVAAELAGQFNPAPGAPPQPLSLTLSGYWSPALAEVSALSLRSGAAQAKLTARVEQPMGSAWRARGQLAMTDFDPQLWMPWPAMAKGTHRLQGEMTFDVDAQAQGQISGQLNHSQLAGVPLEGQWLWKAPVGQPDTNLKVDLTAGGNQLALQAVLPLARPEGGGAALPEDRPQHWQLQAQAKALQALQPITQWWGWHGLQGQAVGNLSVDGIWPAVATQGQLDLTGLQVYSPGNTVYSAAQVQGHWRLNMGSLSAPAQAQWTIKQGRVGATQIEQWALSLEGSAQSHRLTAQGDVRVPGKAGATVAPPRVHLDLALQGRWLEAAKGWSGQVQRWSAVTVEASPRTLLSADQPLDVAWAHSEIDNLLSVSPGRVSVLGVAVKIQSLRWQVPHQTGTSGGNVDVSMEVEPLKLADALARMQPQEGWGGDMVVAGQLHIRHNPQQPWQVDAFLARQGGDLTLSEPAIVGGGVQTLGIRQARVELKAKEGVWTLVEQLDGRVLGNVTGQQTVKTSSPDQLPALNDRVSGSLDVKIGNLRPWGVWAPAGWRLSGQLEGQAVIAGTLGAPEYKGQLSGQNLGAVHTLLGVNLTDGQLLLALQGDQARLTKFTAKGGGERGGVISLEGDAVLGTEPQAHLKLQADHFALLQRVDRRAVISGQAQLTLGAEDIKVDGRLLIDEGLIDISKADAPTVGDDVNVINRPGELPDETEPSGTGSGAGTKRKLQVAVDVDLGQKLRLKGRGLDARLVGNLRLTTPNGRPAMHGVIKTASGSYVAYAQKLIIERGSLAFSGTIENPRLDILAMRAQSPMASSDDVKVGVTITGTAQDPRVRLYSDPSMSETEKLSWLILGRGAAGLGGADIGLLQTAASALLAGEGGSPKDSVLSAIGLDDLSVRQTGGEVRETIVNVGKQISRSWYVGYERSLNATAGNWQVIYRLAQRFTVRAQAGQDSALDLIWAWQFD
ncbi:MAG: translocation/assembly module TamB domain-containing protein [Pseudomonadota bacterium]